MKYNKLPKMVILSPFSTPIVKTKINKFLIFLKTFVVAIAITLLSVCAFYLNVNYEQSIIMQNKVRVENIKAVNLESGIVLDTTAAIIERDGKLPLDVAKKYAMWIYEAGAKYNVDPLLILSVMSVESGFNYRAMSPTGPIGLLQVAYSWHKEKTTQAALFDPKNNIYVGTLIIKEYADRSRTDIETLLRFNGSLGSAPVYAIKVLGKKTKYNQEIMEAIVRSI